MLTQLRTSRGETVEEKLDLRSVRVRNVDGGAGLTRVLVQTLGAIVLLTVRPVPQDVVDVGHNV